MSLRQELRRLVHAYLTLLSVGRDRIVAQGGTCDPVDVMVKDDPYLRRANDALMAEHGALLRAVDQWWKDLQLSRTHAAVPAVLRESFTAGWDARAAIDAPNDADAEDAAKWRALRNCARITALGSAGLGAPRDDHYAHLTLNFWTVHEAVGPTYAVEWLDKFIAIAIRAQAAKT